jgi:hypothetical protein
MAPLPPEITNALDLPEITVESRRVLRPWPHPEQEPKRDAGRCRAASPKLRTRHRIASSRTDGNRFSSQKRVEQGQCLPGGPNYPGLSRRLNF